MDDVERAAYVGAATALWAFFFASLPKIIYWAGFLLGRLARAAKKAANRRS